ncbi:MAG: polyprenol monophosphomannose synthase [Pirellulaceae bacterium]
MVPPPRILVVMATYNEIDNLPELVDEIRRHLPGAEILVIDDNSPDGTGQWCDSRSASDPQFRVLHRSGKLGLGSATVAGLRYAIDENYDFAMTLDADFSHPPHFLPALLAELTHRDDPADVVIGSRYVPGGGIEGWPWHRHVMSRCVNWYTRWMLNLPVRDCSGAFRGFRVAVLRQLPWDQVRSQGYSLLEEMLWMLQRLGARIREVPITYVVRTGGQSKITSQEARAAFWLVLRLWCEGRYGLARRGE